MKKLIASFMVLAAVACSSGGNTYVNEKYGYSVTMPDNFRAQNEDAEMEAERGGKLFISSDNCSIDVTADEKTFEYITPAEMLKQGCEFSVSAYDMDENGKVISQNVTDNDFTVVGDDGSYLQAERVLVKGNTVVTLYVRYPSEQREKFDKESAEIMKSLQFN